MSLGDALTLVGLSLAVLLYALQRAWEQRRELDAAVSVMRGIRHGMGPAGDDDEPPGWASVFFKNVWTGKTLEDRAQADYDAVMEGGYNQVFEVDLPTAPLAALITGPGAGTLIRLRTIEVANHALFQFGVFNQLARQQTDFWERHLAEIADTDNYLPRGRRQAIASAARTQSRMLHGVGVGTAGAADGWFTTLTSTMDDNIAWLNGQREKPWWHRAWVYAASVVFIAMSALAIWQGIDADTDPDVSKSLPAAAEPPAPSSSGPAVAPIRAPGPVARRPVKAQPTP